MECQTLNPGDRVVVIGPGDAGQVTSVFLDDNDIQCADVVIDGEQRAITLQLCSLEPERTNR